MDNNIKITETEIKGMYVIQPPVFKDSRGGFTKVFHVSTFKEKGLDTGFKESYYSTSHKDVVRGMHFQLPPHDHAKLVYVTHGSIIDVVLDVRKNSETFGKHFSVELSAENGSAVYISKGLAHGFKSYEDNSAVTYLQTTTHSPEHDRGIKYDSFGFDWQVDDPILSDRDKQHPTLKEFTSPF